jgi:predicted phosphodiesterase
MKVQIMSDLHFDYHADGGVSFIRSLDPTGVDVLVIAGDMCELRFYRLDQIVESLCARYPHIVYVMGNHEWWHTKPDKAREVIQQIKDKYPRFHILQNEVLVLDGQRFVGTTMWWGDTYRARMGAKGWIDFRRIEILAGWVWDAIKSAQDFLDANVKPGDVVVTHHLPLTRSIDPRFYGRDGQDNDNCYYLNDQARIFQRGGPKLWVHGHTHLHQTYMAGDTRVVCNPLGNVNEPTGYVDDFVIEV